jgi:imidazolonepropionase
MTTLLTNINRLVNVRENSDALRGKELSVLPVLEDAFLLIEDGVIAAFGPMEDLSKAVPNLPAQVKYMHGRTLLPCWCDSHTHLVYAGSREQEFVDKIRGLSYAEIAAKGGGILHSAEKLNSTSEDELFIQSWKRLEEVAKLGTGSIEIKSGYGLSVEGELKMLRVIKRLKEKSNLHIRSTFLGAHAFPAAYRDNHDEYIRLIIEEMLPVIADEELADFIDVFCENGFFSPAETEKICRAGLSYGLKSKLHVNQLNSIGGIETGIACGALSLDHLETLNDTEIKLLSGSDSICTLLPTAAFFLRMGYQPARALIDSGAAVALASDLNPGSSPSGNMNFVVSLSCIQMRMTPEESINAATLNGACAMELEHLAGSITVGKSADLIITKPIPSLAYLPYAFGSNLIDKVMLRGQFI